MGDIRGFGLGCSLFMGSRYWTGWISRRLGLLWKLQRDLGFDADFLWFRVIGQGG